MNEPRMQTRWTRAAQMICVATVLSGSAACNQISGVYAIDFGEAHAEANGGGGGGGGSSGAAMNVSDPTSSVSSGPGGGSSVSEGEPFDLRCDKDTYVVGVAGHAGAWLDAFSLQCANSTTNSDAKRTTEVGGDKRDSPYNALCADGEIVVKVRFTVYEVNDYVLRVEITCASPAAWILSGTTDYKSELVGANGELKEARDKSLACPRGRLAVGIRGSATDHVVTFSGIDCVGL